MKISKLILSFFLISVANIGLCQEWELAKDKNGIKVFARKVSDSEFYETKSTCHFKTTKDEFLAFVWDIENYPNWQSEYKTAKIIANKSNNDKTAYLEFEAPWPINNRDVVIDMKQVEKDNTTFIYIKVNKTSIEPKESAIRMSKYDGYWEIKESGDGIEVTQQMSTNPEGYTPAILIEFYKVTGPFNAFNTMQEMFN